VGGPLNLMLADGAWVAAAHSSLGEIWRLGHPLADKYLRGIFTTATASGPTTPNVGHALLVGVISGLAHGLPVSAAGQSFALPFLFGWTGLLPAAGPGAWSVTLLAAGIGLAWLLKDWWEAVWRSMRTGAAPVTASERDIDWTALAAAVVPCYLIQWRLTQLGAHLQAAAAVGLLLVGTGLILMAGERWAQRSPVASPHLSPWLACGAGIAAGLGALPGLSALAILMAVGLYGRMSAEAAARFGLMVLTVVLVLQGLVHLPEAVAVPPAEVLLLAVGAVVGAPAGGWVLLRLLGQARERALPALASYATAVGGILMLFGVLAR